MWGYLSKAFLIVIVVLAFPTGLILASQDANPGDNTYPIKRGMEGVLQSIVSLNPVTRAYFKTDLSNRRFEEAVTILKRDNIDQTMANTSLIELLSATANASADIKNVSDPNLKKTMANNLANQITTYRQNLAVVAKETHQITPTPLPTGSQGSSPTPTSEQTNPTPTLVQTTLPTPTTTAHTSTPTPTPTPTPTAALRSTPTPTTAAHTPTPTSTAHCIDTTRNSLLCGGDQGVTSYPKTSLLIISESTNSCTGAKRISVISTVDLQQNCTPTIINLFGQCSASNLDACDAALAEIQKRITSSTQSGGSLIQESSPSPTPTVTLTPTPTPTASVKKNTTSQDRNQSQSAFSLLQERSSNENSGTPSVTPVPKSSGEKTKK